MLTRWLTFAAFLAGLSFSQGAATDQDALRITPTCRVKGHPEVQLTLKCGDGTNAGVVQYWHTPFGALQSPSFPGERDPVFMHLDGSLVIPNSSVLHGGLYYCLLQHTEGTTLWPYELLIGHNHQERTNLDDYEPSSSCASIRFSRDVESEEKQADISDKVFAGAVAASVLLTFVFGFSIGALSRNHVLRVLGFVTKRLRLSRQQTDTMDSDITMTTMPPTSQGFEMGNLLDDTSVNCRRMDTAASSTASSPPTKPQRSFRHKKGQQETAAYLEKCDNREEERKTEEEEAGRSVEEKKTRCEEEEREVAGSQSETDNKSREGTGEKDRGQSREERERRQEEEEEADVEENKSRKDGGSEEGGKNEDDEQGRKDDEEKAKTAEDRGSQQTSTESEDNESDGRTQVTSSITAGGDGEEELSSPPCPARRIIRLYQYDEDGQRYCHLPDPAPDDPGLVPRPRQRTRSLTRLSAIMAAASSGPLDRQDTGREDGTHFHMDI